MNGDLSHEEASAFVIEQMQKIGKTYGRIIFRELVMFDLSNEDLRSGIDAAVDDVRDVFVSAGICQNDIDVACWHVELAIIQEGRRLAEQLPVDELRTVQ